VVPVSVRPRRTGRPRGERGAVIVTVALVMIALLLVAALAVDVGYSRMVQRGAQGAADAAALAAARELGELPDAGPAQQEASVLAARNMVGPDATVTTRACTAGEAVVAANARCYRSGDVAIVVETPFVPDGADPEAEYVRVRVCEANPQFFSAVAGVKLTSCATAVAERRQIGNPFGTGIIVLAPPETCPGLEIQGNADISVTTVGAVYVDEACPNNAMQGIGNSLRLEAGLISVVGGTSFNSCGPHCFPGAQPKTGQQPIGDPLGDLPHPPLPTTTSSCASGNGTTCSPGRYNSKKDFGGGQGTITLQPGIHYFRNGVDFRNKSVVVAGPPSPDTGNGVLLFIESGVLDMQGNGTVELTPPDLGDYAGISIYQGRSNTGTSKITGNTEKNMGTVYAPVGRLEIGGNARRNIDGMLIADSLYMFGNMDLNLVPPMDISPVMPEEVIGLYR